MKAGNYIKDSEGNIFRVISINGLGASLKGETGEKEICVSDLKFFELVK